MTDYTELEEFLWEWAQETVNPKLSEIFEDTNHQEFFEVEPNVFIEL